MQKIMPHLWFDKEALEAAKLYVSLFKNSEILSTSKLYDTPSGEVDIVEFKLSGLKFQAISAGPYFNFNPSVSLMIACSNEAEVDRLYAQLSVGGSELMPLGEYPFSKHYAWLQDRYGLSWQLFMVEDMSEHQRIRPSLLFAGDVCGQTEAAMDFYQSVFDGSSIGYVNHYAPGEASDQRAKINYAELNLPGMQFILMDHGYGGEEIFNEAISFMILCDSQEEINYYWDKLSYVPEAEQCGWVKDRFGVSWQIVPTVLDEILADATEEEMSRYTDAFMKMKKFDIEKLEKALKGI
jgi:predicted 3-demethylubiquinone-9 3-methyltransferase (glyoxalase superfamily)